MKKITQKEQAYAMIKRDILSGAYKPGDILNEIEMATKYKFGKTPTREALLVLAHDKFLKPMPRVGYIVTQPVLQDVLDVFQLRAIIESEAIGIAIDRLTPAVLKELDDNNAAERAIYNMEDADEMRELGITLNREFHLIIARATGNARLVEVVNGLINDMMRFVYMDPEVADHTQHMHLLSLIQDRKRADAQEAMRRHIEESRNRMMVSF